MASPYNIKLYTIFSAEAIEKMNGARGKMVAQGGHAFVGALLDSMRRFPKDAKAYMESGGVAKIALIAPEAELHQLLAAYKSVCGVDMIVDAAHTVFKEPTLTCLGLGPINVKHIGADLKAIKIFN
jgi:peptidyl-tRNA hydrolase